jgi:hypothetical protein
MSVLATEVGLETRREAIAPRVDAEAPLLDHAERGGSGGGRAGRLLQRDPEGGHVSRGRGTARR